MIWIPQPLIKQQEIILKKAEKENEIIYVNFELPKSFVVTDDKIYVSPLNTSTLLKRTRTGVTK